MQKDWNQELQHFNYFQDIIRHNIRRYEAEFKQYHAQAQELHKAINSGDIELYNQLMTTSSIEEHAETSLRKNLAALQKPYFGRIDYTDYCTNREEQIYIGKNGIFQNPVFRSLPQGSCGRNRQYKNRSAAPYYA